MRGDCLMMIILAAVVVVIGLYLVIWGKPSMIRERFSKGVSPEIKWAPSQGAWQRQLNQNAIRAAARLDFLRPEDGKSPYQLQLFAKRAEKDVSR